MDWIQQSYENRKLADYIRLREYKTTSDERIKLELDDNMFKKLSYITYITDNGELIYGTESDGFYEITSIDDKTLLYVKRDKKEYAIQECIDKLGFTPKELITVNETAKLTLIDDGKIYDTVIDNELANSLNKNVYINNGKILLEQFDGDGIIEFVTIDDKPIPTDENEIKTLLKTKFNIEVKHG